MKRETEKLLEILKHFSQNEKNIDRKKAYQDVIDLLNNDKYYNGMLKYFNI